MRLLLGTPVPVPALSVPGVLPAQEQAHGAGMLAVYDDFVGAVLGRAGWRQHGHALGNTLAGHARENAVVFFHAGIFSTKPPSIARSKTTGY